MISIYDIAKAANVSAATVSRALANSDKISLSSREKIQRIAEEMGYRPNFVARNLRQKSTSMIGLVLDDISDELSGFIAKGVEDEARKNGLCVLLWNIQHDPGSEKSAIQFFSSLKLDGVIFADTTLNSFDDYPDLQIPTVLINRSVDDASPVPCVLTDDYSGAYDATQFLLKLKHRKIGYINGPMEWNASQVRLSGYLDALRVHEIEPCDDYITHGDWYEKSGYELAKKMLQLTDRPTAIFASSDMMASGVLDAARELGISVPDQLSVMGYDDRQIAQYMRPRLTTISLPLYDVGATAIKVLSGLISNKGDRDRKGNEFLIKGRVIERETTRALLN
ncbi:LacI family DNA-binding transcriptional regulator [Paenibacillus sp. BC26]|uniref:LacI family DNA-binding transcriptional regulator n=1 Tax=Paenibacillus sp. BC26 TaxID=1881032 RepID=UPI0008EB0EEA|nr:LacI family DNA-binding transcriptional regulator [Paenibacillus sp. BC26]SFS50099.1 transcriptional regulator, LacI family [Paenibacillus sp. BC26]